LPFLAGFFYWIGAVSFTAFLFRVKGTIFEMGGEELLSFVDFSLKFLILAVFMRE
jgi:hypothetical protein